MGLVSESQQPTTFQVLEFILTIYLPVVAQVKGHYQTETMNSLLVIVMLASKYIDGIHTEFNLFIQGSHHALS